MIKDLFPIFSSKQITEKPLVYLDSAATTHKPASVIDAMSQFYAKEYATINRGLYESGLLVSDKIEQTREKVAKFIGADTNEIVFTSSVTMSINMVALSFCDAFMEEGDEILLSKTEHHSNYLPWVEIAKKNGYTITFIDFCEDGTIDLKDVQKKISSKTKLIATAHVSNVFGSVNPLKDLVTLARNFEAKVFVDGAQAIAHEKVDVRDLDVDFYAFSGHKMYGPTGVGILYGKKDILDAMNPCFFGGSMIESIEKDEHVYRESPYKYEPGTIMLAPIIGLHAAIEFIEKVTLEKISAHEHVLSSLLFDEIKDCVSFLRKDCRGSSILSFTTTMHPSDVAILLSGENVCIRTGNMCCQPLCKEMGIEAFVRVSIGAYNTKEDILSFAKHLKNIVAIKNPL